MIQKKKKKGGEEGPNKQQRDEGAKEASVENCN